MSPKDYDLSDAVDYHYGAFPPSDLNYAKLIGVTSRAASALGRYDEMLRNLHNSEILLAPLRRREAVISSRIEGTVATLEEVLKFEAEGEDRSHFSQEVVEVYSFAMAMIHAQKQMDEGLPISGRLIKNAHRELLFMGRGADKEPGEFKRDQNYVVDRTRKKVLFTPIDPARFPDAFAKFESYVNDPGQEPLLQAAIAHAEFEALHPFKDGNGRIGRMLITLMLWNRGLISAPHFYISANLEMNKTEYIDRLRLVSAENQWTEWIIFFLGAVEQQASESLAVAESIGRLYEEMKKVFRETTSSQWSTHALDFIFNQPVFKNSTFTSNSGIPYQTANRITNLLKEQKLLLEMQPASGRRPALYAFSPLLALVR